MDFDEAMKRMIEEEEKMIPPGQIITAALGSRLAHLDRRIEHVSADLLRAVEGKPEQKYLHFSPTFGQQVICEELYDWLAGRTE